MSERIVEVVVVGEVRGHPNADRLEITEVHGGYPCIVRKGEFEQGDMALYVPIDMMVPADDERWEFLGRGRTPKHVDGKGYFRIRAIRLRGIFSMGVLLQMPKELEGLTLASGLDYADMLGIIRYEPPEPMSMGGENEKDPGFLPCYDLEGLRRYIDVLLEGEEVVITEKLHGCNGRWAYHQDRLWAASRTCFKRESPFEEGQTQTVWWKVAKQYELEDRLSQVPGLAIYGEVFGQVQDLKYGVGVKGRVRMAVFDVLDIATRRWFDHEEVLELCERLELPSVPLVHVGPWNKELMGMAEGVTLIDGAHHVREGIVIKPTKERFDERVGRVVLKLHGEGYLTRKKGG